MESDQRSKLKEQMPWTSDDDLKKMLEHIQSIATLAHRIIGEKFGDLTQHLPTKARIQIQLSVRQQVLNALCSEVEAQVDEISRRN